MKKTSGNDLMRFNGDPGANSGARRPEIGPNDSFYTDYSSEAPADPVVEVDGYFDGDYSVDAPYIGNDGYNGFYDGNDAEPYKVKSNTKMVIL